MSFASLVQGFDKFVRVDAVHGGCLLKRFAVSERAMQAMHAAFHEHLGELVGIALLENVYYQHVF